MNNSTQIESISEGLRIALLAYNALEPNGTARAVVAQRLFGVAASSTLLPRLDEVASLVTPTARQKKASSPRRQ